MILRKRGRAGRAGWLRVVDRHQLVGVRKVQRGQQNSVEDAEDRRGDADRERQGQNDNRREAPPTRQRAQRLQSISPEAHATRIDVPAGERVGGCTCPRDGRNGSLHRSTERIVAIRKLGGRLLRPSSPATAGMQGRHCHPECDISDEECSVGSSWLKQHFKEPPAQVLLASRTFIFDPLDHQGGAAASGAQPLPAPLYCARFIRSAKRSIPSAPRNSSSHHFVGLHLSCGLQPTPHGRLLRAERCVRRR